MVSDLHGNQITGASAAAADHYATAIRELLCYVDDPVATLAKATDDSPRFAMAHLANGHIHMAGSEKAGVEVAEAALQAVANLPMNERERAHAGALEAYAAGEFARGHERLEEIVIKHPRDLLAVQIAHLWDFFRGDARRLRDRVAIALPAWSKADPDYHALLGMHSFGLEECGEYARAEEEGRRAIELNRRDSWAQHAVAHVLEMQSRTDEGIRWMRENEAGWAPDNFFAIHNWWHLALYHLDRGDTESVFELYDGPIRQDRSSVMLDLVDASALLWRLHLSGLDVGDRRWDELADDWRPFCEDGFYAFNDVHALMAFVGAGRQREIEATLRAMEEAAEGRGTNAAMTREVGLPVARALIAFGQGRYDETVRHLRPIRSIANRFGGSHAQRDLIDWTLTEAAIRSGDAAAAAAFTAERLDRKPESPLNRLFSERTAGLKAAA